MGINHSIQQNESPKCGESSNLPKTMKAAIATGFGSVDDNVFLCDSWPVPRLATKTRNKGEEMLIKVFAVALAPGDPRILSGATRWIQLPKSGHPYIIGSDVAGVVVEVGYNENKFNIGDYVVSRFELPGPVGGAAEYRIVKTALSEVCPSTISPVQACGLSASAAAAKKIVHKHMKSGDRVLVIGGSGGVGTNVIQYAKMYGASFVAAVSTRSDLCRDLGADRVIDYQREMWWEVEEFQSQENKFDIVFDMVGGDNWTVGGRSGKALHADKSIYYSLEPGVATEIVIRNLWDIIQITLQWIFPPMLVRMDCRLPIWIIGNALDLKEGELNDVLQDVAAGKLLPVIDPASPFEFTQAGIRDAMKLQKSCHAQGKVVIQISPSQWD